MIRCAPSVPWLQPSSSRSQTSVRQVQCSLAAAKLLKKPDQCQVGTVCPGSSQAPQEARPLSGRYSVPWQQPSSSRSRTSVRQILYSVPWQQPNSSRSQTSVRQVQCSMTAAKLLKKLDQCQVGIVPWQQPRSSINQTSVSWIQYAMAVAKLLKMQGQSQACTVCPGSSQVPQEAKTYCC